MQAWLRFAEWQEWCWNGGDFDSDYFNKDLPVTVLDDELLYLFQETMVHIQQSYQAWIPLRFLTLEFHDNIIGT